MVRAGVLHGCHSLTSSPNRAYRTQICELTPEMTTYVRDSPPCQDARVQLTVLAGGIGAARFLRGLRTINDSITVIGNTADDIWLHGLRICPDLDTVMYTLGGGISAERGWGREDETFVVMEELAAYEVEPTWFGLGDRDIATHLVRTQALNAGFALSDVTSALCDRWQPGVRLLPMTDDRVETHVVVDDPERGRIAMHFQEWWIRYRAELLVHEFAFIGMDEARPAPGVLEAIADADVIVLPPSNPVVSIGTILGVPGIADAVRAARAPVVGVSPIIANAPVRGMADACLRAIDVPTTALGVAMHYGARASGGLLDAWLVDDADAAAVPALQEAGIRARALPLYMTDVDATATIAQAVLDI
jgi:LPPG:FO 2-phospho-L-lactate transferase